MMTLILTLVVALAVTFFAFQNTQTVNLHLAQFNFLQVPVFFVIIVSMLIGLLVSWVISSIQSVFIGFNLRGKNAAIRNANKDIVVLKQRVRELELENARFRHKETPVEEENAHDQIERPSIFRRFRHAI